MYISVMLHNANIHTIEQEGKYEHYNIEWVTHNNKYIDK